MEIFHTETFNDPSYFIFEFLTLFHKMLKFDTKSGNRKRDEVTESEGDKDKEGGGGPVLGGEGTKRKA